MATYTRSSVGEFGVLGSFVSQKAGLFRIAEANLEGYVMYVGVGAGVMPDLNAAPAAYSATLPFAYTLPLPGVGTQTYNVLVRKRNQYGLESQNQKTTPITVDSAGAESVPPFLGPLGLNVFVKSGGVLRVTASYPGYGTDDFPATTWRVWVAATPPDPDVDTPTTQPNILRDLAVDLGPYAAGKWYVTVTLYRQSDGLQSEALTTFVTIPSAPASPTPVPGQQIL